MQGIHHRFLWQMLCAQTRSHTYTASMTILWNHSQADCHSLFYSHFSDLPHTVPAASTTGAWHPSLSCRLLQRVLMCSWRSTTLSLRKELTSSTANFEWCHVRLSRDSYSTFIHRVIWLGKNFMELFFNAKFHFKSTWNHGLPLTLNIWFVSHLLGTLRN